MTDKNLYDRLGGVFAIAAVVATSAMRSSRIRSLAKVPRTPRYENGTPSNWAGCRA
jgi:hypothetical protein